MLNRFKIALYTLLSGVNVALVGQLKLNEIMVLLSAPFVFDIRDFRAFPMFRKIIVALTALFVFQAITDLFIVNSTAENFMRGWAAIIMSILSFLFLFKIMKDDTVIFFFLCMTLIKNIIWTDDNADTDMSYFKFKMVPILSYGVYVLSFLLYRKGHWKAVLALLLSYCLLCIARDSRSTGMIFFLGAIIIYCFNSGMQLTRDRLLVFGIAGLLLFQFAYGCYVNAVLNHEWGGEHASEQIERLDNPYNPLELLMTGRGETFAALAAIGDAPLFGHGSWAKDDNLKYYRILLLYQNEEMNEQLATSTDHLIPSHSILLGAWVNCGIGGFLAVLAVFILLLRMGFYLIGNAADTALYPVLVLMTLGVIWTFLFSPIQQLRFNIPAIGAILLRAYYECITERNEAAAMEPASQTMAFIAPKGEI
ncbi:O-antigen ligase family protein [Chitinophaga oryzae]|uniref:O-antigen ligase family protein n=1 Tax=Chitinophaga oryzae TaxID=2725414 RepID=A0AAE6ZFG2_9BACT|nr:O-antigen ligase family protein [Chitinophaga oryzae]QJB30587.1 O-antigen ligase family protein [Chitinophaga oryzae]QJB37086.1 O-antigen ligase family protein [Chitinophaga oryzae]